MADPVDLLPVLYEASAEPEQWPVFLRGLSDLVDARMATFITRDENSQRCTLVQSGVDPEAQRLYLTYYWGIDAFFKFSSQRGFNRPGAIAPAQVFVSDKELLATEYCNDFLLKFGMFRHCLSLFGKNGVALSSLAVMRSIREEPFDEPELDVLSFLAPHVQQAIRLNERFHQLRLESEAKSAALDQVALGVVFLDARGRVLGTNEAAAAILTAQNGLSVFNGRLKAAQSNEDRALHSAIFHSCQTGSTRGIGTGGSLLISRRPPAKPLQLVVGPACTSVADLACCPSAVVFMHDLSARIRPRAELLKELYGLTPAESRMAYLLLDGKTSEEIAGALGISRNTIKTQLQSIFAKTGVRRQSELMRVLMYLPIESRLERNLRSVD